MGWGNSLISYIGMDEDLLQEGYIAAMDTYDLDPMNADTNAEVARYNYLTDFRDDAVAFSDEALRIDPDQPTALWVKSMTAYDQSGFTQSTSYLLLALAQNPTDLALIAELANRAFTTGNYEKALSDIERILELAPEHPVGWALRGRYHQLIGKGGLAKEDCTTALSYDARYAWSLYPDGLPPR